MPIERQATFCRNCHCKTTRHWQEPPHYLYSTLTLSLMAAGAVTPMTGMLMAAVWLQRLATTGRWACPHCKA